MNLLAILPVLRTQTIKPHSSKGIPSKNSPEGVQLGLEKHFLPRRLAGIWTPLYKSKALASDPLY